MKVSPKWPCSGLSFVLLATSSIYDTGGEKMHWNTKYEILVKTLANSLSSTLKSRETIFNIPWTTKLFSRVIVKWNKKKKCESNVYILQNVLQRYSFNKTILDFSTGNLFIYLFIFSTGNFFLMHSVFCILPNSLNILHVDDCVYFLW